ncbi:hypothetical protein [Prevotella sp.]|uniref:hypothetical protein n=1 Tax=Prevotella sp. TaxID=59823 RepID=UPI0027E38E41|nr:hypothetical protein [Prevotella sp.]
MFDFFDYNFSSLISIFAALMGMAYPLILQAIQRIDEMYNSSKLAAYFQKQWFFHLFSRLLLVSIPVSIVAPFLLYYFRDFSWMMILSAAHALIVFALAMSAFILFKYIMMTINPSKFFEYLEYKLYGSHPPLTEIFQIQKYASDKDNEELFGNITTSISVYLNSYRKNKRDDVAIDVWKMFRELYKQHSKRDNHFFSNRNLIVSYFFSPEEQIFLSEEEYIYIWQTVDAVVHADNESWVYNYWTYANQYYMFTLDHYSKNDEELKLQQERFKEQHFMIGALLTYNQKYVLLKRLMYFSNALPPTYDLVPSSFNIIILQLKSLIEKKDMPIELTKQYLMIGAPQDVSSDGFILSYAYKYASLLLIRLFTVNDWNITYSNPMGLPEISSDYTVEDLNEEVYMMNRLKHNISSWFEEKDAIRQTIGEGRVVVDDVLNLCDEYIERCKKQIETLNNSMEVDPEKQEYIKSHLLSALKDYPLALPIFGDINTDDYERNIINNYVKFQIDKEILKVGTNVNASNLPDVIVGHLNELAYKAYNLLFLIQSSVRNVRIAYKDIKRVLDVIGVNEKNAVISLGVYLGNYEAIYGKEDDDKFDDKDGYRTYKGCNIYSIPSTQKSIVVMQKSDIPFVRKEKLADDKKLDLIDEEEFFYSNINSIKDLSEKEQFLLVDRGLYFYSKERFRYIRLNVDYNSGFETDMNRVKEAREVAWP